MTEQGVSGKVMFNTPIVANYTVHRSNRSAYRPHNDPFYGYGRRRRRKKPKRKKRQAWSW